MCARRPADNAAWNAYARAATAAGAARAGTRWLGAVCEGAAKEAGGDGEEEDEDEDDEDDDEGAAAKPPPLPPLVLLGAARTCGGDPARGAADLAAARKAAPGEPLPALGLAVALAALAAAAAPDIRHRAAAAALAHLADYARLRGHPSEAAYNTGRLLHGLGVASHAAAWYGRALADATAPLVPPGAHAGASVAREAAHNLALLLRGSGSEAGEGLARRVLRKYATY